MDEIAPCPYVVKTSDGSYCRNHKHLVRLPVQEADGEENEQNVQNEILSSLNSQEIQSKTSCRDLIQVGHKLKILLGGRCSVELCMLLCHHCYVYVCVFYLASDVHEFMSLTVLQC